jgi:hypothetical protein
MSDMSHLRAIRSSRTCSEVGGGESGRDMTEVSTCTLGLGEEEGVLVRVRVTDTVTEAEGDLLGRTDLEAVTERVLLGEGLSERDLVGEGEKERVTEEEGETERVSEGEGVSEAVTERVPGALPLTEGEEVAAPLSEGVTEVLPVNEGVSVPEAETEGVSLLEGLEVAAIELVADSDLTSVSVTDALSVTDADIEGDTDGEAGEGVVVKEGDSAELGLASGVPLIDSEGLGEVVASTEGEGDSLAPTSGDVGVSVTDLEGVIDLDVVGEAG